MYYRFFKSLSVLLIVISHTYIGSMHNTPHFIVTSNGAIYKNYQSIPQNSPSAVLPVVEEKKELRCLCCCPSMSDCCTDQAKKMLSIDVAWLFCMDSSWCWS